MIPLYTPPSNAALEGNQIDYEQRTNGASYQADIRYLAPLERAPWGIKALDQPLCAVPQA